MKEPSGPRRPEKTTEGGRIGDAMDFNEKRRAQRIEAELPILVEGGPAEASGKTLNISTNGICFEIPHHIEPLTRVRMEMFMPARPGGEDEGERVGFDGIVVRTEPEHPISEKGSYRIAVFFTYVSDDSMKIISSFIERHSGHDRTATPG